MTNPSDLNPFGDAAVAPLPDHPHSLATGVAALRMRAPPEMARRTIPLDLAPDAVSSV